MTKLSTLTLVRPSDLEKGILSLFSVPKMAGGGESFEHVRKRHMGHIRSEMKKMVDRRENAGAVLEDKASVQNLNQTEEPESLEFGYRKIKHEMGQVAKIRRDLDMLNETVKGAIDALRGVQGKSNRLDTRDANKNSAEGEQPGLQNRSDGEEELRRTKARKKNRNDLKKIIASAHINNIKIHRELSGLLDDNDRASQELDELLQAIMAGFADSAEKRDEIITKLQVSSSQLENLIKRAQKKISDLQETTSRLRIKVVNLQGWYEEEKEQSKTLSIQLEATRKELGEVQQELRRVEELRESEKIRFKALLDAAMERERQLKNKISILKESIHLIQAELASALAREDKLKQELHEEVKKRTTLEHWLQMRRETSLRERAAKTIIHWLVRCLRRRQTAKRSIKVDFKIPSIPVEVRRRSKEIQTIDKFTKKEIIEQTSPPKTPNREFKKFTLISTTHGIVTSPLSADGKNKMAGQSGTERTSTYHVIPTINADTKFIMPGSEGKLPYDNQLQRTLDRIHRQQKRRSPDLLVTDYHLPLRQAMRRSGDRPNSNTTRPARSVIELPVQSLKEKQQSIDRQKRVTSQHQEYKTKFHELSDSLRRHKQTVSHALTASNREKTCLIQENKVLKGRIAAMLASSNSFKRAEFEDTSKLIPQRPATSCSFGGASVLQHSRNLKNPSIGRGGAASSIHLNISKHRTMASSSFKASDVKLVSYAGRRRRPSSSNGHRRRKKLPTRNDHFQ